MNSSESTDTVEPHLLPPAEANFSRKSKSLVSARDLFRERLRTLLLVASVVLVSFLAIHDVLGYQFSGGDAIPGIEATKIETFADLHRILTSSWLTGYPETQSAVGLYFRPLTSLSYSLDYAIWGLNPFGFQLTDILLHLATVALLFFLMRNITHGKNMVAWLASFIFSLHPIILESVASPERRNDVLMTLFLLASFLFFLSYQRHEGKWRIAFSIGCFFLAAMSKELAVTFPLMLGAFLFIQRDRACRYRVRFVKCVYTCSGFIAADVAMVAWRSFALHGAIDTSRIYWRSLAQMTAFVASTVKDYVFDLTMPGGLAGNINAAGSIKLSLAISLSCLLIIGLLLFSCRSQFTDLLGAQGRRQRMLRLTFGSIALMSIVGMATYPLWRIEVNKAIDQAFAGTGYLFLQSLWDNKLGLPVESFYFKARNLIITGLAFVFVASTLLLLMSHHTRQLKRYLKNSESGRIIQIMSIWLLIPFAFFMLTESFAHRYMYLPLVPFSIILAIVLSDITAKFRTSFADGKIHVNQIIHSCRSRAGIIVLALAVLLLSFIPASPLFQNYGEWSDSGKAPAMILNQLEGFASFLPAASQIHIGNFPCVVYSHETEFDHPQEIQYIGPEQIGSWLRIKFPEKHFTVTVDGIPIKNVPASERLHLEQSSANNFIYTVQYEN